MKKLLLFVSAVALTASLNSCSSSSSGGGSSMSMKVGGTKKTFQTEGVAAGGGTTYVFGWIGDAEDPTEQISFTVTGTGADKITSFVYSSDTDTYTSSSMTSNITTNSTSSSKGTFSGTASNFAGDDVVITEGTYSSRVFSE